MSSQHDQVYNFGRGWRAAGIGNMLGRFSPYGLLDFLRANHIL